MSSEAQTAAVPEKPEKPKTPKSKTATSPRKVKKSPKPGKSKKRIPKNTPPKEAQTAKPTSPKKTPPKTPESPVRAQTSKPNPSETQNRTPSPKRSRTGSPSSPRFSRIASPTKATKELSEATPFQVFQRQFLDFHAHIIKLHQIGPPIGSEKFFVRCHICQGEIQNFEYHFTKIMKQKVLNAPLNPRSLEVCKALRENFPVFLGRIDKFGRKIPGLFERSMLAYIHAMQDNYECFCDVCSVEPVTRTIMQQYEGACRGTLRNIEASIQSLFHPNVYNTITYEEALELTERVKTFGRFFVIDLQRILMPYWSYVPKLAEYYGAFRYSFLELVPLICAIPNFRDEFEVVRTEKDHLMAAFEKLMTLLGTVISSTSVKVKTSVTQQPELAVQKIDPLEEPMRQFSAFLECEFDEKAKKVARFETLRKKAEEKITALEVELEKAKEQIEALEKQRAKEMIEERFEQIRTMKAEMSKNDELKRDKFMRDVMGLLRPLTKDKTVHAEGDYIRQLRTMIQGISQNVTSKDIELHMLSDQIEKAKAELPHGSGSDKLVDIARDCGEKLKKLMEETNMVRSKLKIKDDEDLEEAVKDKKDKLKKQKKKIKKLKDKVSDREKSKKKSKEKTVETLTSISTALSALLGDAKAKPPEKMSKLRDAIKDQLKRLEDQGRSKTEKPREQDDEKKTEDSEMREYLVGLCTKLVPGTMREDLEEKTIKEIQAIIDEHLDKQSTSDDAF